MMRHYREISRRDQPVSKRPRESRRNTATTRNRGRIRTLPEYSASCVRRPLTGLARAWLMSADVRLLGHQTITFAREFCHAHDYEIGGRCRRRRHDRRRLRCCQTPMPHRAAAPRSRVPRRPPAFWAPVPPKPASKRAPIGRRRQEASMAVATPASGTPRASSGTARKARSFLQSASSSPSPAATNGGQLRVIRG